MSGYNYSGTGEYNFIGSIDEAMQIIKAIGLRDKRIRELEAALHEAIEIIEGTGLDASSQRAALSALEGARS
jgi:cation diffusion facilitator CzcD-associated flavoprotein CzcO